MGLRIVIYFCSALVMFFFIKNQVTYRNMKLLGSAIYTYNEDKILKGEVNSLINYPKSNIYERYLFNPFAWSYKYILKHEHLEMLEPYIDA